MKQWFSFFSADRTIGSAGEDAACIFLKERGYRILEQNYRNTVGRQLGEIDIIARDGDDLVFVEVKTRERRKDQELRPESAIRSEKLRRLSRIAEYYVKERGYVGPYRFDAIAVEYSEDPGKPLFRHFRDIYL